MLTRLCIVPGTAEFQGLQKPTPCQSNHEGAADGQTSIAMTLRNCRISWTCQDMIRTEDFEFPRPFLMGFTDGHEGMPTMVRQDLSGMMPGLVAYINPPDQPPGKPSEKPRFTTVGLIITTGPDGRDVTAIATKTFHMDVLPPILDEESVTG